MLSCILLSAGASTRFGSPKALAEFGNTTVLGHILETLQLSEVPEIIIVLGAQAEEIKPVLLNHKTARIVYHKDHKFGQTSSFQAGLKEASPDAQGFFLWPVDYPWVRPETVRALQAAFLRHPQQMCIPTFHAKKGHPPVFPAALKETLLGLAPDTGVHTVLQKQEKLNLLAVEDPGVRATFNTPEEFELLKRDLF